MQHYPGASPDDRPGLEDKITEICRHIPDFRGESQQSLTDWPAIQAGIEMALTDLKNGGSRILFPSPFTTGKAIIPINGLIWMGRPDEMLEQIENQ